MHITKSIDERINSGEFFLAVLYATLFLLFLVFGLSLHLDHVAFPFRICSALADGGVIVMACMWLKGKWRYIGAALTFALETPYSFPLSSFSRHFYIFNLPGQAIIRGHIFRKRIHSNSL